MNICAGVFVPVCVCVCVCGCVYVCVCVRVCKPAGRQQPLHGVLIGTHITQKGFQAHIRLASTVRLHPPDDIQGTRVILYSNPTTKNVTKVTLS